MPKQKRITIENNIKFDTDSKKYYVTFYFGKDNAGKNIRKTKSFTDLTEAQIALQKHELEIKQGLAVQPSKITLASAIDSHLNVLSLKSEASTIYGYRTIEKHVKSHPIGKKSIQNIKPTDIQEYLLYLQRKKELSSNTALKHYNFLNSVFNLLEQQEAIARNPVKRVISPKKVKHQADFLTVEEAKEILKRVKGDRLEVPLAIALYTGMRRGEICGLKWQHIDFDKNCIHVVLNRINVGSTIVEKAPKSDSSERTISIVPELKQILLDERQVQQYTQELLGKDYSNEG